MRSSFALWIGGVSAIFALISFSLASGAHAETAEQLLHRIERLESQLAAQQILFEEYKARVDALNAQIDAQVVLSPEVLAIMRAGSVAGLPASAEAVAGAAPQPIGEAPSEKRPQLEAIAGLPEIGGVLTPAGHLAFEPAIEYSHASANRFTFRGVELQEAILIGVIEASDADRDFVSASATFRLGVTNRLEVEARIPVIYRSDNLTFSIPVLGEEAIERSESLTGSGIGDVEVAGHYQLNPGAGGWPLFVANVRVRFPTGRGPFDVSRDEFGVETELATGAGFYEVEPSFTAIFPSDPVVLFANVGYGLRLPFSPDETVGDFIVKDVDPGDAINASFGMAFAANDDLSFTLGYKHTYLSKTELKLSNIDTGISTTQKSAGLHVGSTIFGVSYKLSDDLRLNFDLDYGVTEDAPDMRAGLRLAIQLGEIF